MKPILINDNVARTCFEHAECGMAANDVTIEINRIGGGSPTIIYPALDVSNGKLCFAWDDVFYQSMAGRYQGVIRFKGGVCRPVCVHLLLKPCNCFVGATVNELFISKKCAGCE